MFVCFCIFMHACLHTCTYVDMVYIFMSMRLSSPHNTTLSKCYPDRCCCCAGAQATCAAWRLGWQSLPRHASRPQYCQVRCAEPLTIPRQCPPSSSPSAAPEDPGACASAWSPYIHVLSRQPASELKVWHVEHQDVTEDSSERLPTGLRTVRP